MAENLVKTGMVPLETVTPVSIGFAPFDQK